MRLCDDYAERHGLGRLRLRHSSKFFVFFESGNRLLSCKWIQGSSGYYEFCECILGSSIVVLKREQVEWDRYESHLQGWIGSQKALVFDEKEVFHLVWRFFVMRNERFLAANYDPLSIYDTLEGEVSERKTAAMNMVQEVKAMNVEIGNFWKNKACEILDKYAYWLSD